MKRPTGRLSPLKKQDECSRQPACSAPTTLPSAYIRITFFKIYFINV